MRALRWGAGLGTLLCFVALGSGKALSSTGKEDPARVTTQVEACQSCHEKEVATFRASRISRSATCDSCHGDTSNHLSAETEKGERGEITSFSKMKAAETNQKCITCHEDGAQAHWAGGAHERRGVSCTSCHSIHSFKSSQNQLKTAHEPDTCYACHSGIRAQSLRTSHHPVREGLMSCSSCHNAHDGSRPKMIKADWNNELCLQCHTEKRGPFFWEHAPVRENCLNCHNPHGSNHDKMLVSQQPWLCQRCHLNTRHPGTLYSNINAAGDRPTASNRAVEHACKNCHQNVHGGNAPTAPYLGR